MIFDYDDVYLKQINFNLMYYQDLK